MEYGFGIPTRFPLADHPSVEAIATHAEAPSFSRLAVSDHFIPLLATDFRYPYAGAFPDSVIGEYMEQFTFIVFLAALTLRGWLLTSVTAAPRRDAIETTEARLHHRQRVRKPIIFEANTHPMEECKVVRAQPSAANMQVSRSRR